MRGVSSRSVGFTLVELLIGVVILALITGASASAISRLGRVRDAAVSRQQAFTRAEAGASQIAADVMSVVRDGRLEFTKVQIVSAGGEVAPTDELLLLTRAVSRVRGAYGEPEGGDFEVQYRVAPTTDGRVSLWRRCDPALDQTIEGGGVATPIAPGVYSLSIEAFDGDEWWDVWDSDADGLPHGVRIVVSAEDETGRARAVVRRVVALDRVPVPTDAQVSIEVGGGE